MKETKKYPFDVQGGEEYIQSLEIEQLAHHVPIVKVQHTDHTSLGPFVRVTQDKEEHKYIYVMAFFNEKVKDFNIDASSFDASKKITIIANQETNISKEKQNLVCFKFVMKHKFPFNEFIDIEIDFNKKRKGYSEPKRGTLGASPGE